MIVRRVWPTRPTFDGALHHHDTFRRELLPEVERAKPRQLTARSG